MDDTTELSTIESLNKRGEGVAADGRVAPGALPGERVQLRRPGAAHRKRNRRPCGPDLPILRGVRRLRGPAHGRAGLRRLEARLPGFGARRAPAWKPKSARWSTRMARGAAARRFTPGSCPFRATRSASCAPGRMRSWKSTPARCSAPTWRAPSPPRARSPPTCADSTSRSISRRPRPSNGLDFDIRGSGPVEAAETRKLVATAEAHDLARVTMHGRSRDRAAFPGDRVRRGARRDPRRRIPAGDDRGRDRTRRARRRGVEGRATHRRSLLRRRRLRVAACGRA